MISKLAGIVLKKNTKTKVWWIKLGLCLVMSNIFFFLLFGDQSRSEVEAPKTSAGEVEVQLTASLLTPFQEGKMILLIHRKHRSRIEGVLKSTGETGTIVGVSERDALSLLAHEGWEILPYLKDFRFQQIAQGDQYEIRY